MGPRWSWPTLRCEDKQPRAGQRGDGGVKDFVAPRSHWEDWQLLKVQEKASTAEQTGGTHSANFVGCGVCV